MNYFAITFAVNAHSLCRFGLGLAFVQHQIDRALAQSHLSVVTKPSLGWLSLSEHQRELASRRLRLRQGRKRDPSRRIDKLATNEPGHVLDWVMHPISYARHRFPSDIIRHAVGLDLKWRNPRPGWPLADCFHGSPGR
jgi:hypothetical protein